MNLNKHLVTGGIALLTAFSSVAQEEPKKEKGNFINSMSVGGAVGLSLLHGDVRQYKWAPVTKFNSELGFVLPSIESSKFPGMFEELDRNKNILRILNIGISITTLEEVFLK